MWTRKGIGRWSGEEKYRYVVGKMSTIVHSREVGGQNWVKFVHVVVE